ncbi:MAG: hypothetical protein Q8P39_02425 [Candidatus Yanofskybacteria bacterium]|nr:hypothetical protein [Candidatus Yanofskybacteria bacterium]
MGLGKQSFVIRKIVEGGGKMATRARRFPATKGRPNWLFLAIVAFAAVVLLGGGYVAGSLMSGTTSPKSGEGGGGVLPTATPTQDPPAVVQPNTAEPRDISPADFRALEQLSIQFLNGMLNGNEAALAVSVEDPGATWIQELRTAFREIGGITEMWGYYIPPFTEDHVDDFTGRLYDDGTGDLLIVVGEEYHVIVDPILVNGAPAGFVVTARYLGDSDWIFTGLWEE